MTPSYEYRAICQRVVDGDTIIAHVDLGFRVYVTMPIRLATIDAPEIVGTTKTAGLASKNYLIDLIEGMNILLKTYKPATDKYGRYLADIYLGEISVNKMMVEAEHAVYTSFNTSENNK